MLVYLSLCVGLSVLVPQLIVLKELINPTLTKHFLNLLTSEAKVGHELLPLPVLVQLSQREIAPDAFHPCPTLECAEGCLAGISGILDRGILDGGGEVGGEPLFDTPDGVREFTTSQ